MVKREQSCCMEGGDTKLDMINTDLSTWHWNTDIIRQMKSVVWAKAKNRREENTLWWIQRHKFNMKAYQVTRIYRLLIYWWKKFWSESCISTSDFQKSFAFKTFERKSLRGCKKMKPKCGELRLQLATKIWSNHSVLKNNEQYGARCYLIHLIRIQRLYENTLLTLQSIWEFTWERGTVLAATENTETKGKNPSLRNYNLAVMKAAS